MGRPSKDRVQMTLYIDRDIAEELKLEKNRSEAVNNILRDSLDRIGMFGSEDVTEEREMRLRKRIGKIIKDEIDEILEGLYEDNCDNGEDNGEGTDEDN